MALDLVKVRNIARIAHTEDDPFIAMCYASALLELETRTGWCLDSVSRTQYVAAEPDNTEKLLLADRQPVTAATFVDTTEDPSVVTSLSLVTINGLQYINMDVDLVREIGYPIVITLTAGNGSLNALLEMAVTQRTVQLVASRGDDTQAMPSDYWDRITAMMGKGIG